MIQSLYHLVDLSNIFIFNSRYNIAVTCERILYYICEIYKKNMQL